MSKCVHTFVNNQIKALIRYKLQISCIHDGDCARVSLFVKHFRQRIISQFCKIEMPTFHIFELGVSVTHLADYHSGYIKVGYIAVSLVVQAGT